MVAWPHVDGWTGSKAEGMQDTDLNIHPGAACLSHLQ